MTEAEAREIIERYEALLASLVSPHELRHFPCPLEVIGADLVAVEPDDMMADGSWSPAIRRQPIAQLARL